MEVSGGLADNGQLVATVHVEGELLLAAAYADGFVVEYDEVTKTWQLDSPLPPGMASTTVLDPGGQLEVAHPLEDEAVVVFRDDSEYRYHCFTDEEGSVCQLD